MLSTQGALGLCYLHWGHWACVSSTEEELLCVVYTGSTKPVCYQHLGHWACVSSREEPLLCVVYTGSTGPVLSTLGALGLYVVNTDGSGPVCCLHREHWACVINTGHWACVLSAHGSLGVCVFNRRGTAVCCQHMEHWALCGLCMNGTFSWATSTTQELGEINV